MKKLLISLIVLFGPGACAEFDYDPVVFEAKDTEIVAQGTIDHTTLDRFQQAMRQAPNADTLVLQVIDGSADDAANLRFSQFVRNAGFATRVPSDGLVASGGTDLFLAGISRTLEDGACVGVHSWGALEGLQGDKLSRSHPLHQPYLAYYNAMGIPRDFYWFTLEAAPVEDIHWMTTDEVLSYKITTSAPAFLGKDSICSRR